MFVKAEKVEGRRAIATDCVLIDKRYIRFGLVVVIRVSAQHTSVRLTVCRKEREVLGPHELLRLFLPAFYIRRFALAPYYN